MSRQRNYRPQYGKLYPGVAIRKKILRYLEKNDRWIENHLERPKRPREYKNAKGEIVVRPTKECPWEYFGEIGHSALWTTKSAKDCFFEDYDAKCRAALKLRLRELLSSLELTELIFLFYRFVKNLSLKKCGERLDWSKSKARRFEKELFNVCQCYCVNGSIFFISINFIHVVNAPK